MLLYSMPVSYIRHPIYAILVKTSYINTIKNELLYNEHIGLCITVNTLIIKLDLIPGSLTVMYKWS